MEDKSFELLTQMFNEIKEIKAEIKSIHNTVVRIENNHGQKLEALFEGNDLC